MTNHERIAMYDDLCRKSLGLQGHARTYEAGHRRVVGVARRSALARDANPYRDNVASRSDYYR